MTPTEKLRAMLDERGVEWTDGGMFHCTRWVIDGAHHTAFEQGGKLYLQSSIGPLTPEQAIFATVGNSTDLASRLREVYGLHAFAELFGFDWTDESDWDWHDVACAMADAIDATVVKK
jgi:hypothetical protein